MNTTSDNKLLKNLLQQVDLATQAGAASGSAADGVHPDEEMLAMFGDGDLTKIERTSVVEHLAGCVPCRKLVSRVLIAGDEDEITTRPSRTIVRRFVPILLAVAALVVVGIAVRLFVPTGDLLLAEREAYDGASELLASGDDDGARELLADAQQRGITSGRLTSLDVQALRRIPDPLALASVGRLSDFGYGIGGIVAMGPQGDGHPTDLAAAEQRLQQAGTDSLEVVLNRGHVLLAMGKLDEAIAVIVAL